MPGHCAITGLLHTAAVKTNHASWRSRKVHRLLVNRQDQAPGFAEHLVTRAGRVDAQSAGGEGSVFVPLGAREDEDVFVAFVEMPRHAAGFLIAQQRGRGAGQAVAVKPMDLHAFPKWLPREAVGIFGQVEKIGQFDNG